MDIREAQGISDLIVDKVKEELEKQGRTHYWLALQCCLTEAALSYIFNHKRRPSLYTIIIITDALGIKLSDVIKELNR